MFKQETIHHEPSNAASSVGHWHPNPHTIYLKILPVDEFPISVFSRETRSDFRLPKYPHQTQFLIHHAELPHEPPRKTHKKGNTPLPLGLWSYTSSKDNRKEN